MQKIWLFFPDSSDFLVFLYSLHPYISLISLLSCSPLLSPSLSHVLPFLSLFLILFSFPLILFISPSSTSSFPLIFLSLLFPPFIPSNLSPSSCLIFLHVAHQLQKKLECGIGPLWSCCDKFTLPTKPKTSFSRMVSDNRRK